MWLRRAAVAAAVVVGAWTRAPLLRAPPTMDDHLQRALLEGTGPMQRAPWALFAFVRRGEAPALRDAGLLPWWTDDSFSLVMFRPLTALTLWLDHALGGSTLVGHLHSLGWWFGALAAMGWTLRAMVPPSVTALALGVCALAPTWTVPLGWMANRGVLVAGALGWAAVGLWVRGRWAWAALLMSLAGLGGEYALGPCLVGLAWTFLGPATTRRDPRSWSPVFSLAAVLGLGRALGAGASGGTAYLDPFRAPGAFLAALPERLGCLWAESLLALDTVAPDGTPRTAAALPGWIAAGVLAVAVGKVRAGWSPEKRRGLDALCLGGVAATLTFAATPVHGRVMAPIAACVAAWVAAAMVGGSTSGSPIWLRVLALGLGLVHFVAGPVRAYFDAGGLRAVADASTTALLASGRTVGDARRVYLLAATHPEMLHYTPMLWRRHLGLRVGWTVFAATAAPVRRVTRAGGDGFELDAGGASLVSPWAWRMYRRDPLRAGTTLRVGALTVTVLDAPRGVPTRLWVRGEEAGVRWMRARGFGLEP